VGEQTIGIDLSLADAMDLLEGAYPTSPSPETAAPNVEISSPTYATSVTRLGPLGTVANFVISGLVAIFGGQYGKLGLAAVNAASQATTGKTISQHLSPSTILSVSQTVVGPANSPAVNANIGVPSSPGAVSLPGLFGVGDATAEGGWGLNLIDDAVNAGTSMLGGSLMSTRQRMMAHIATYGVEGYKNLILQKLRNNTSFSDPEAAALFMSEYPQYFPGYSISKPFPIALLLIGIVMIWFLIRR
jgi:hypothetical protein